MNKNLIVLYRLDLRLLGGSVYYFHGHNEGEITWKGNVYTPISINADGLEMRGDSKASSPRLVVADVLNGVQGGIGALCRMYDDFAGAKVIVTHVIDSEYKEQEWYVEQRTAENPSSGVIEFELANPMDFEQRKLPSRIITSTCHWAVTGGYRGESCGYTGAKRYTIDGKPTDDPALDRCGGCISDCRLRFGLGVPLPFGGFAASNLV